MRPVKKRQTFLTDHFHLVGIDQQTAKAIKDQERNVAAGREIILQYINSLKTGKSDEQVKPELPEGVVLELTDEQIEQMHEEVILAILEQYKDNPEQAEQLKEFLVERLEYHRKLRNTAKEKEAASK